MGRFIVIAFSINIGHYSWRVDCFVAVSHYDEVEIVGAIERIGASKRIVEKVKGNLRRRTLDTGFTLSNKKERISVMVIGLTSSSKEEMNSISHELRHLVDDIASTCRLNRCGEEVAYLTGDLASEVFSHVSALFCDKCRHR
ncbi:MAG: hypothetical protein MJZ98_01305 [Paludibacteraceae bacterium]|nr:hypothetical protein [Paludibacteraceae bacterium]